MESVSLLRLHDLDCVRLDDEGTLSGDLLGLCTFFGCRFGILLFDYLLRDQVATDRVRTELGVNFDLLVLTKDGLVNFFQQDLDLGVAEAHHGSFELLLAETGSLTDLRASHLFILVKKAEDGCLEHIDDQLILFLSVLHL